MKTAAAGSAQIRKESTLGKLLNVERKECAQVPLKNQSGKAQEEQGLRDIIIEDCTEDFHAKKSLRREKRNRWSAFVEEIDEISSAVRSRKVAQGLSPSEQRRSPRGVIGISESSRFY